MRSACPTQGGAAFYQGDQRPLVAEFAYYLLEVAGLSPEAETIHLVMDSLSSHSGKAAVERFGTEAGDWLGIGSPCTTPEARQLVEPGGYRDQYLLPAMLGPTPDWDSTFIAEGNAGVEPPHESRPSHDPVELYSHAGSQEIWLQNHAVTVLVVEVSEQYIYGSNKVPTRAMPLLILGEF